MDKNKRKSETFYGIYFLNKRTESTQYLEVWNKECQVCLDLSNLYHDRNGIKRHFTR